MRTIYIDSNCKCHTVNDGTMTAVETYCFDGLCDAVIEGYCAELDENDNIYKAYLWKPYSELAAAQQEYERQLLADYESALSEIETALGV